jgi:hypothetical protein
MIGKGAENQKSSKTSRNETIGIDHSSRFNSIIE